jgi:hypothetical protein
LMSDSFGVLWQINMIKLKCFVLYAVPMHATYMYRKNDYESGT